MIYLDTEMPKDCDDCIYQAAYDDGARGCYIADTDYDNEYGTRIIDVNGKPDWCLLRPIEYQRGRPPIDTPLIVKVRFDGEVLEAYGYYDEEWNLIHWLEGPIEEDYEVLGWRYI